MADRPVNTSPELSDLDPTPVGSAVPTTTTTATAAVQTPQRPQSPRAQAKATLKEAFPNVDDGVIEAVLIASGGNIEPAFNALLGMTDPSYRPESADVVVPRPSESDEQPLPTSTPRTQLELDEQFARQLAAEGAYGRQVRRRTSRDRQQPSVRQQQGQDREHSFIDDDLPIIKDNIKKGWSTFIGRVKSKLDGEPEQPPAPPPRPGEYGYHRQSSRYDADPRVLGDDFSHLKIQDHSTGTAPRQSHRPLANPNLFKSARFGNDSETNSTPPAMPPRPDLQPSSASTLPTSSQTQTTGGPSPPKKWEPLRPAEDRDPFAVGDSDDEEGKEEDLYGAPPVKSTAPRIGAQESGIIPTPLDSAGDGKNT